MAPRLLSTVRLDLRRVLDLRDEDVQRALGVTRDDLVADDPAVPRAIGEQAHDAGFEAIVAPSAAGPGDVIALFPSRLAEGSAAEVVGVRAYPAGPD